MLPLLDWLQRGARQISSMQHGCCIRPVRDEHEADTLAGMQGIAQSWPEQGLHGCCRIACVRHAAHLRASHLAGPVSAPSCWLSNSKSCCSRSISRIRGTPRIRMVVPAIQAALPVCQPSFLRLAQPIAA